MTSTIDWNQQRAAVAAAWRLLVALKARGLWRSGDDAARPRDVSQMREAWEELDRLLPRVLAEEE